MFTLTAASKDIKNILKWTGIILGVVVCIFILIKIVIIIKESLYPTPPPKPTVSFGKLPAPLFPKSVTEQKLEFSLDTVSGKLPSVPNQLRVYKTVSLRPNLLSLPNAVRNVKANGFDQNQTKISDSIYFWNNKSEILLQKLEYNIYSGNFILTSDSTNSAVINPSIPPTEQASEDTAKSFLENMNSLSNELDLTQTQTQILTLEKGELIEATSIASTKFVNVDFFQKDLNGYPIFYEKPNRSNISLLVGSEENNLQVIKATYVLQTASNMSSTYPLISTEKAYEILKNGGSYIASYYGKAQNVSIKNVYLSYYISSGNQDYITPIIIFEGDNGFFAYINAIRDEWISK